MLSNVRKECDHLTSWICPAIKKELEAYFTHNEGFKHRCLTNVANRASLRVVEVYMWVSDLHEDEEQSGKNFLLDREATLVKTVKYTHTLKTNKERFADEQSVAHYEDYTQRLEAVT
ncbi:uncharacterized protein DS421_16g549950 [Arachis hypogaea]|nr:uncharacterized protein DS421_16g549950 [Arachis hypogaea]